MLKNFLFIGGDERQLYAADYLLSCGYNVSLYGFGERDSFSFSQNYDCIIFPTPYSKDSSNIFAPLTEEVIPFSNIKDFNTPRIIIGGGFKPEELKKLSDKSSVIDILNDEEYNILNATATAEVAICLAIKNTSFNLQDANVLVAGYGKIGKILSQDLKGMGAKVYTAARKETDLAYAKINGYVPVRYKELPDISDKFDIIFNTVPSLIIKEDIIKNLKAGCLIIDLASKPGGVDFAAAQRQKIRCIHALGLPGIYSPETSGKIVAKIILKITGGI